MSNFLSKWDKTSAKCDQPCSFKFISLLCLGGEGRGSNEILGENVVFWEEAASALDYQPIAKKKNKKTFITLRQTEGLK